MISYFSTRLRYMLSIFKIIYSFVTASLLYFIQNSPRYEERKCVKITLTSRSDLTYISFSTNMCTLIFVQIENYIRPPMEMSYTNYEKIRPSSIITSRISRKKYKSSLYPKTLKQRPVIVFSICFLCLQSMYITIEIGKRFASVFILWMSTANVPSSMGRVLQTIIGRMAWQEKCWMKQELVV